MLKIICNHLIFICFFALTSLACFGSNPIEGPSPSLKRARPHFLESSSDKSPSPPRKRQKVAATTLPFTVPQKEEAIFRIVHHARIVDGLALVSTCRAFVSLLQDERLWKDYVHRIPGHHAFIGERPKKNRNDFYKALFKQLLRPYFSSLSIQSKAIYSDVRTLNSRELSFWGSITSPLVEDEQENSSQATTDSDSTYSDSEESDILEDYDDVFEQATAWKEGILSFVPTLEEALGSCVLSVSDDHKMLVGSYNHVDFPSHDKAASWCLNASGLYEMRPLPDENATDSIAKAVNHDGTKIIGNLYSPLPQAVVWENNVLSFLEIPQGITSSIAISLDTNGDRIVGYLENASKHTSPALWVNKRFVTLPLPFNNLKNAVARVINTNGTLIAGYVGLTTPDKEKIIQQAVLWKTQPSAPQALPLANDPPLYECCLLPMLSDYSHQNVPQAIDASGERIVGYEVLYPPQDEGNFKKGTSIHRAVLWTRSEDNRTDVHLLQGLLSFTIPPDYRLIEATCIDSTGTIIGGNGHPSAWWIYFPKFEAFLAEGIPLRALKPWLT